MLYKYLIRPILFRVLQNDPERAHEGTLALLALAGRIPGIMRLLRRYWATHDPSLARTVFGLRFPGPVGLAAGMDKDGAALPIWAALGFGFVEIGTITWYTQPGNPRPRLFRLTDDHALINRMGFNNRGASALAARLSELPRLPIPIGVSLGKSRNTPLEESVDDYRASLRALYDYANYFAINVSSPNTPGLRSLQDRDQLALLLGELQRENWAQNQLYDGPAKPLLVKIAPDLSNDAILEVLDVCDRTGVSGIIAVNTTLSRDGLHHTSSAILRESGGLSGRPLFAESRRIVRFISQETGGQMPIIGVGGIFSADDAQAMLDAGASLIQVYTGLVYQGPALVREINHRLHSNSRTEASNKHRLSKEPL